MIRNRRLAGISGIAFAVTTLVGFVLANPPGGKFHPGDVADFVASGHRSAVIVSLYLVLIAAVALVGLGSYLREDAFGRPGSGRLFTGLLVGAATSWLAGWAIVATPSAARSFGGAPAIDAGIAYMFTQAGFAVMLVGGGALLGAALLTLAIAGGREPTWVRVLAGVAGVAGFATPAFFPVFLLLLFGLVVGAWLLVSSPDAEQTVQTA